jgi:hypothetical protein
VNECEPTISLARTNNTKLTIKNQQALEPSNTYHIVVQQQKPLATLSRIPPQPAPAAASPHHRALLEQLI